jgi:primosomal protein N' (replication factor Y)
VAPEISQAELLAGWMREWIRQPLAVVHGALSAQERWEAWQRIRTGEVRIVVGTRIAVFSPVQELGMIVLDREDDPSHKEQRAPHYDARRVAEERAGTARAALLWGTPTPSVEMARAIEERRVVAVPIGPRSRPRIAFIDVRAKGKAGTLFSPVLQAAVMRTLPGSRVILFVPRRGYADFLLCHECGHVPRCPQCDVAMTFHRRAATLRCHLCARTETAPTVCPRCGGTQVHPHGVGSEAVEAGARRLFKRTPVLRLDSDAAPTEEVQQRVWAAFAAQGGILVGTQLLTKGTGQVPAALIGVLGIDSALYRPDFRATEHTYQVLSQLALLAQREMLIQTYVPSHPALRAIQQQDARPFYRAQLAARERAGYPPYRTLINVVLSGPHEGAVRKTAEDFVALLAGGGEVLGPAPAPESRRRGQARWQILIKEFPNASIRPRLRELQTTMAIPRSIRLMIDVDPVELI